MFGASVEVSNLHDPKYFVLYPVDRVTSQGYDALSEIERSIIRANHGSGLTNNGGRIGSRVVSTLERQRRLLERFGAQIEGDQVDVHASNGHVNDSGLGGIGFIPYIPHEVSVADQLPKEVLDNIYHGSHNPPGEWFLGVGHLTTGVIHVAFSDIFRQIAGQEFNRWRIHLTKSVIDDSGADIGDMLGNLANDIKAKTGFEPDYLEEYRIFLAQRYRGQKHSQEKPLRIVIVG